MQFRALNHPLNWFPNDAAGSLELLHTFASNVEIQVRQSVTDFEANVEELVIEGSQPDEPTQIMQIHQGLDDQSWDLHQVFREYFPSLQRRSALITIFAFFEHELNKLCALFQATEHYKVALRDLSGSGVERARTNLCKIATVDLVEPATAWNEVKNIQSVRNVIVHADGRLREDRSSDQRALRNYIESCQYLTIDRDIVIHAGYLKHVLLTFGSYFEQIHLAIHLRYDA